MPDWAALIDRLIDAQRQLSELGRPPLNDDPLSDWTGPASEDDLRDAEQRLGIALCPGCRQYLATINGQHLVSGPTYGARHGPPDPLVTTYGARHGPPDPLVRAETHDVRCPTYGARHGSSASVSDERCSGGGPTN